MDMRLKNSTAVLKVACAFLFLSFCLIYLYILQGDVLAFTQHVLSKGQTYYDRTIGAVLITFVLWMIQIGVRTVSRLHSYAYALTYFPSLLLLAILTDVSPDLRPDNFFGHWLWAFPLLMVGYAGLVGLGQQYEFIHRQDRSVGLVHLLWTNGLLLVVSFWLTCSIGNTDKLFHNRLSIENCLKNGQYEAALNTSVQEAGADSSLTFLRVWALSRQNKLGEELFEHHLTGGSDILIPDAKSTRLLTIPYTSLYKYLGVYFVDKLTPKEYLVALHAKGRATPQAHDWLLCAYLLDGDLDAFVGALPKYYTVDSSLPKHYREALTMYTHRRNTPAIVYHDSVMDADYDDYLALKRKYANSRLRYTYTRDSYGKTYWFYYNNLHHVH